MDIFGKRKTYRGGDEGGAGDASAGSWIGKGEREREGKGERWPNVALTS